MNDHNLNKFLAYIMKLDLNICTGLDINVNIHVSSPHGVLWCFDWEKIRKDNPFHTSHLPPQISCDLRIT